MKALIAGFLTSLVAACGQGYANLSISPEGDKLAFTTNLARLSEPGLPNATRLFVLGPVSAGSGLRFVAAAPPNPNCGIISISGISDLVFLPGGGIAYHTTTFCRGLFPPVPPNPVYTTHTEKVGNLPAQFPGQTAFSANGMFAAIEVPGQGVRLVNLVTGESLTAPASVAERSALLLAGARHVVTDSGKVLLVSVDVVNPRYFGGPLYLWDGKSLEATGFGASTASIDPKGRYLLPKAGDELQISDLASNQSTTLGQVQPENLPSISGDGERILYAASVGGVQLIEDWRNPKPDTRVVDAEATDGVLSSDGRVAAALASGSVWRVDLATGERTEWLGPGNRASSGQEAPGFVPGSLLRASVRFPVNGIVEPAVDPLPLALEGFSAWMGDTQLPAAKITDSEFRFQLPWEASAGEQTIEIRHERNPFFALGRWSIKVNASPLVQLERRMTPDRPMVIAAHGDFRGLVTEADPAAPGEFLHVYATGLGPGVRDLPTGRRTPNEGVSLATPPVCGFGVLGSRQVAEVLYAGLAGGLIGIYQVDVRVPDSVEPGFVFFTCGSDPAAGGFLPVRN